MIDIHAYWRAVLDQNAAALADFFADDASVRWHCTNEHFTAAEFIRANCAYPGDWDGEIERLHTAGDLIVTAVHVYPKDRSISFHVTSFIETHGGYITAIDEYWGDDGLPPAWRREMHLGRPIRGKEQP